MMNRLKSVDCLRAVAVLLVLGFHLDLPGFEGGYLGVDVFFLISGFIVTRVTLARLGFSSLPSDSSAAPMDGEQILENLSRTNTIFDWKDFFVRRVKRLWPEQMLVMGVSVVVGWKVGGGEMGGRLGLSALSQSLLSANFRFWAEAGSYFDLQARQKPLLHTWSLSVEEQFYIVFAICLVVWSRFRWRSSISSVLIFGAALSSFFAAFLLSSRMQSSVFYLLPFRAWQLLTGCAIGSARLNVNKLFQRKGTAECFLIICFFLFLFVVWQEPVLKEWSLQLATLFIVVTTACLLLVLMNLEDMENPPVTLKCFTIKPIVLIGEISYSIYLWHWPIICFAERIFFDTKKPGVLASIVTLTFVLSAFSHICITSPIRKMANAPSWKCWMLKFGGIICYIVFLILCAFSFFAVQIFEPPRWLKAETFSGEFLQDPFGPWKGEGKGCEKFNCPGGIKLRNCGNSRETKFRFILLGDSMAYSLGGAFINLDRLIGSCTTLYASPGCGPFTRGYLPLSSMMKLPKECTDQNSKSLSLAQSMGPSKLSALFLVARWEFYLRQIVLDKPDSLLTYQVRKDYYAGANNETKRLFQTALNNTLNDFGNYAKKIFILSQYPVFTKVDSAPRNCTFECEKYSEEKSLMDPIKTRHWIEELIGVRKNIVYINGVELFCDRKCSPYLKNVKAWADVVHLNLYGSLELGAKIYNESISKLK